MQHKVATIRPSYQSIRCSQSLQWLVHFTRCVSRYSIKITCTRNECVSFSEFGIFWIKQFLVYELWSDRRWSVYCRAIGVWMRIELATCGRVIASQLVNWNEYYFCALCCLQCSMRQHTHTAHTTERILIDWLLLLHNKKIDSTILFNLIWFNVRTFVKVLNYCVLARDGNSAANVEIEKLLRLYCFPRLRTRSHANRFCRVLRNSSFCSQISRSRALNESFYKFPLRLLAPIWLAS